MKTIKTITIILLSILFFSSCNHQDRLVGKWERFGDRYKGMQIQITNEGGSFKGEIIATTDSIEREGFVVGDIKFKDIKKIADDKYELQSLGKTQIGFSDKFQGEYFLTRLEFNSDTLIHTRLFAKGNEDIGTETQWRIIK